MTRSTTVASIALVFAGMAGPAFAQFGPTKVVTAKAELRSLPMTMTLVGTVEPVTRSLLGAEVAGLVMDMPARQGDLVERGALICKLNDDVLRLQLAREQARLGALQAQLDELLNGTRPEIVARLKAELDAAAAVAQRWAFELERVKKLQGGEYANEKEYQDALSEKLSSESRRLAAQAAYDEAVAGARQETIAQARFAVAEQQAQVDRIQTDLTKTEIRAPFGGNVVNRRAELGNWLSVGDEVVELVDLSTVLVRVNAPEKAIPYATVGAGVAVHLDALSETFAGVIRHVIPQADLAARTFPVEVEIANPDGRLKAGMFARATIPAGPEELTLAVPKDALIDNRGAIQVAMIVDGAEGKMAMPMYVTLGADAGGWIAVTSGNVPPGADVAIYGNEQLVFPQPVSIVGSREEVDAPPADGTAQPAQTPAPAAHAS